MDAYLSGILVNIQSFCDNTINHNYSWIIPMEKFKGAQLEKMLYKFSHFLQGPHSFGVQSSVLNKTQDRLYFTSEDYNVVH